MGLFQAHFRSGSSPDIPGSSLFKYAQAFSGLDPEAHRAFRMNKALEPTKYPFNQAWEKARRGSGFKARANPGLGLIYFEPS